MKKSLKISGIVFLILSLLVPATYGQKSGNSQAASQDPDILIFSTTHPSESYTRKKTGVIKVEIVSFNPIRTVDLNGDPVTVTDDRQVKIDAPYNLSGQAGEMIEFAVSVLTNVGKAQKRFVVHFGSKPKLKVPPFQLVAILGITNNDNINSVTADQDAATKGVLTVVPRYNISFGKNSTLQFKGIILREKYSDDDYQGKEIGYTRLAVGWIEKKTLWGDLFSEFGFNDIRMDNANILVGEEESSQEMFISGKVVREITKKSKWDLALNFKVKDTNLTPANINYESDANELILTAGLAEPHLLVQPGIKDLKTTVQASLSMNDAKGKYMDSATLWMSLKASYTIDKWLPQVKFKTQLKTMAIEDPLKEDKIPTYTTNTFSAKLTYKLFKKTRLGLEFKNRDGSSNIDASNYQQNLITLSATQIF